MFCQKRQQQTLASRDGHIKRGFIQQNINAARQHLSGFCKAGVDKQWRNRGAASGTQGKGGRILRGGIEAGGRLRCRNGFDMLGGRWLLRFARCDLAAARLAGRRPLPAATMRRVFPEENWPESWKYSYPYDLEEVYGEITNHGYAYAYDNRRRQALSLLTEALPPGALVLDIAAAQGNFSLALAEMGYDVTWNDLREDLAGYARLKYERGKISYAPGNAFSLQFPSLFDAVLITEIIEHVAHPDEFLANTAQFVRPGGYVIMTTPNGAHFRNTLPRFSDCPDPSAYEAVQFKPNADGHIFLLHPDEISPLASRAGLEVDKIALFTNPLTNGHMKTAALLRALPRSVVNRVEMLTQRLPAPIGRKLLIQMAVRFRKPSRPRPEASIKSPQNRP